MENLELYRKYRPETLDDMVGNEATIKSLKKELENGSHVFLMTGPAGCGKTTLARIMAREVGAGEFSIHEINSAENRGIDTARDVMEQMRFCPADGNAIVWIFDECFHKDTLIDTLRGRVKISELTPNELIFNSDGVSRINNIQKKKVDLNRLVLLTTNYGQVLTTCEHLFYTKDGFVKCQELKKGDILYDIQDMPNMWEGISDLSISKFKNLRKSLCWVATQTERIIGETESILQKFENQEHESFSLPSMWEEFYHPGKRPSEILFEILQSYWTTAYNGSIEGTDLCDLWKKIQSEELSIQKDLFKRLSICLDKCELYWQEVSGYKKGTNEIEKSIKKSLSIRKSSTNEIEEWDSAYLGWKTWRERSILERADEIIQKVGGGMVFGTSHKNNEKITISDELQSRYRKSIFDDCNRDRRGWSQKTETNAIRQEENRFIGTVRVESVEIYQPGSKSKSFSSYISDNDLINGYVYMYDLEIDGSPTYYANGILVHNCHQWLSPVQNAFLKALEDTPHHVYFFLCTTDPQKLIAPLKSRCSIINVKPLNEDEMMYLLRRTSKAEGKKLSVDVYDRIIELAQGGSRRALKLLAKVLYLDNDEERLEVLQIGESSESPEVRELCKALLDKNCNWKLLSKLLKTIDMSDPEKVRYAVLGYMNAVLLNNFSVEASCAMQAFSNPTYNNGKFQITIACLDYLELKNN